jgi:DHA2 family methylenomycin A resistance protein-like MFS transporter
MGDPVLSVARSPQDEVAAGARPVKAPGWALLAASVALGLTLLNTATTNVALPSIQTEVGGGVSGLQWISNGYALAFASLLLPAGALADRHGSRRVLLTGALIFSAGAALALVAPSLWFVVAGQVIAGVGAAAITPSAVALVRESFPNSIARTRAVALMSMAMAIGFGVGPVAGGLLIETLGWRGIFGLTFACGLLVVVVVWTNVAAGGVRVATRTPEARGVAYGVLTLAALTFTLIQGANVGWGEVQVLVAAAVTVVAALAFVRSQVRGKAPVMPPALFAVREVPTVAGLGLLFNFTAYGQLFGTSLFLQRELGLSALQTAIVFLPAPGGTTLAALGVGRWIARKGPRVPLAVGLFCNGAGAVLLVFVNHRSDLPLGLVALFVAGLAGGIVVPALNTVVAVSSPSALVGVATAMLNASRQVGGVLGVAVLGALFAGGTDPAGANEALLFGASASFIAIAVGWLLVRAGPAVVGR